MVPADKQLEASPLVSKAKFGPKTLALVLVLVIAVPVGYLYLGKPAKAYMHHQAATRYVLQAKQASRIERYDLASKLLTKALAEDGTNPEVHREIAKLLSLNPATNEQALHFWRQLMSTGKATTEDRMKMGASLVAIDKVVEANKILEDATPEERASRHGLELKSVILRREGKIAEADKTLRDACLKEPNHPDSMLTLASLDLASPFEEVHKPALQVMWTLARGNSANALAAVDRIALYRGVTAREVDELTTLVQAIPDAHERHRLLVLSTYLRLHPIEKAEIIREETLRHENRSLEDATDFLRWLDGLNEHKLILTLVPRDKVTKSTDLFVAYSNALVGEQRWSDLRDLLQNSKSIPLAPLDVAVLNARCSRGLGESPSTVRGRLQEALHQAVAARNFQGAQKVAQAATSMGHDDVALEAFEKLSATPQYRVPMLQKMLELQGKLQMTDDMLTTVQSLLHERPGLEPLPQTEIYLQLLLGVEMEAATANIENLPTVSREGRSTQAFLRSFAALRLVDSVKAAKLASDLDPSLLPPGQRAVLSAIYGSTGDARKAFELAEKVPAQLLLQEEKKLMDRSL
jgi:Tfp pilus assembly protein PilF